MATNNPFSPRQVCIYLFKVILDDQDEPTAHFRCQCSVVRKQVPKKDYSNLFDHVLKQHPDFVATMLASGTNTATLVSFIDQKYQTVFCWLDWTTASNLPFTWCENATVAKYTNLANISTETLLKYAGLVVREPQSRRTEVRGSPRFLVNKIQDLMRKLRNLNHSAKLRKNTYSAPSYSTYKMVKRFFAIKDFVDTSGDELAELMPTRNEENKLWLLQDDLRELKLASKKLQSDEKVTLLDVRDRFDALIERHPSAAEYLAADASVVKSPAFENACVKVLLGKEMELTGYDHELLAAFATPVSSRCSGGLLEGKPPPTCKTSQGMQCRAGN
ncbi:hypothetical protein PC121_g1009 [Phytophthora cactorum]|nr:hypothetical protein PC121_g1009 [Phytophthora cactorum]